MDHKKIIALLGAALLALPLSVFADQMSDLLAQLAALQQQIQTSGGSQTSVTTQAQSTQNESCPNLYRTIQYRSRGADVGELQQFFIDEGLLAPGSVSNYFGVKTERAVQIFQTTNHIISGGLRDVTGFGAVGRRTRVAIAESCQGGSTYTPYTQSSYVSVGPPPPPSFTPPPPPTSYPTVVESLIVTPTSGVAPLYASITAKMSCDPSRTYSLVYGDGASQDLAPPGGNCVSPRSQTIVHPYSPAGSYNLTLVANGNTVSNTNITVTTGTPSCWINSSLSTAGANQQFSLNWSSSNATQASLTPLQNNVALNGGTTTTALSEGVSVYTLTVTGPGGTASCSTSVAVQSPLNTRDQQRMSDIMTISGALKTYYAGHGAFPNPNGWINDCSISSGSWLMGLTGMPHDPVDTCVWPYDASTTASTATYAYWSDSGQRYAVVTRVENTGNFSTVRNAQTLWFDRKPLTRYGWNSNAVAILGTSLGTTTSLSLGQRDQQRITDLQTIAASLKDYYTTHSAYPTYAATTDGWIKDCNNAGASWIPGLSSAPRDPVDICVAPWAKDDSQASTYAYFSDGPRFALATRLENSSNSYTIGNRTAQQWFDGKALVTDHQWNSNVYAVLVTGAQTQARDPYANLAAVLAAAQSVLQQMLAMFH